MKKLIPLALSLAILGNCATPVSAARVGQVVDYALHTDIVAQINGHPLRSYNVGGRTAVVAEDLKGYGFWTLWDGSQRTLRVQRATRMGTQLENPAVYPQFQPENLSAPIGSRAQAILSTDIKTYVAGEPVSSFNIDGETLIWFSDLDAYGELVWDEQARTANLVLGDPMEIALKRVAEPLVEWSDLTAPDRNREDYQLYPGEYGTLFVGCYRGTSHGNAWSMEFVKRDGEVVDVDGLMPVCGFGTYYLNPEEIRLEGEKLFFVTPVKKSENETGMVTDLGKCLVEIHLTQGKLVSVQPLYGTLEQWDAVCALGSSDAAKPESNLDVTFIKQAGEGNVAVLDYSLPYSDYHVEANQSGILLYMGFWQGFSDPDYEQRPFGRARQALSRSDLPSVFREGVFSEINTEDQRLFARQYFRVTLNGEPVSGNLWWSGGNGHSDLRFNFDRPVAMSDGDVLRLWVGSTEFE